MNIHDNGILAQLGEHLPYKQRVTGSSPVTPMFFVKYGGVAQLARACGSYPQCPRFKSRCRYQTPKDGTAPSFGTSLQEYPAPLGQPGPLVKWLRQRPLTPLTSVRIRYGSPDFSRAKVLDKGSEIQYNTVCSPARPDDIELVLIRARVHPFPFRTRKLSSLLPKILVWRRTGKIGNADTENGLRMKSVFSFLEEE